MVKNTVYGGDFGEKVHASDFVCDGLVWPIARRTRPWMNEIPPTSSRRVTHVANFG